MLDVVMGRVIQRMVVVPAKAIGSGRCVKVKLAMQLKARRTKTDPFPLTIMFKMPQRAAIMRICLSI